MASKRGRYKVGKIKRRTHVGSSPRRDGNPRPGGERATPPSIPPHPDPGRTADDPNLHLHWTAPVQKFNAIIPLDILNRTCNHLGKMPQALKQISGRSVEWIQGIPSPHPPASSQSSTPRSFGNSRPQLGNSGCAAPRQFRKFFHFSTFFPKFSKPSQRHNSPIHLNINTLRICPSNRPKHF